MEYIVQQSKIRLVRGDITSQDVDAIVNAANKTLLGGGGVDGAIHRAAGPLLREECKSIRREVLKGQFLETGRAVITKGYNLKAKYVIHIVGPICSSEKNPGPLLKSTYKNCLHLANENAVHSMAFPSISTGAFGCDIKWASKIALAEMIDFLKLEESQLKEIRVVLFSQQDYDDYAKSLTEII